MATTQELFDAALAHHQAKDLAAAETGYRQVLELDPQHADAWHLLGLVMFDLGRNELAADYMNRAIAISGDAVAFHGNLGVVYQAMHQWDQAMASYRRAIEVDPKFADAYNNLGTALMAQGKLEEAIANYKLALKVRPEYAEAYVSLGNGLKDAGKMAEAVACYRAALQIRPDYPEAYNNLGIALKEQGNLEEAIGVFRKVVELWPDYADAYVSLGNALKDHQQTDDAIAYYQQAVELRPQYAEAYNNLGSALQEQKKLDDAVACYRRALEIDESYVAAQNNLGIALKEKGQGEAAIECYRRALELKPDFAEAYNALAAAVKDQGRITEALGYYRKAIELKPEYADAHNNMGIALKDYGDAAGAIAAYRRAIELRPDYADAHLNLSMAWLSAGNFREGWPEYEWRWRTKDAQTPQLPQPRWQGEPVAGKTIFLHCEQGYGDTLQFIRYANVLHDAGARVIVGCQPGLLTLLNSCRGVDVLMSETDPPPDCDFHTPLMSVPAIVGSDLASVPAKVPYLSAAPELVEKWREKLSTLSGLKIGICWQGNRSYADDRYRSIPLRWFVEVLARPGVSLLSLQKREGREQLAQLASGVKVADFADEMDEASGPFMDTAAVMKNLDLIVSSDTATPHLAGALGVPVWLALPFSPDWRWLLEGNSNPWYPTFRVFRQKSPGDWRGVFTEISRALSEVMGLGLKT